MKTLVLGATTNKERYAYKAIHSLIDHSHQVVAVGAKEGMALDVKIETSKVPFIGIDTVTIYLNPKNQQEILRLYYFSSSKTRNFQSRYGKSGIL